MSIIVNGSSNDHWKTVRVTPDQKSTSNILISVAGNKNYDNGLGIAKNRVQFVINDQEFIEISYADFTAMIEELGERAIADILGLTPKTD